MKLVKMEKFLDSTSGSSGFDSKMFLDGGLHSYRKYCVDFIAYFLILTRLLINIFDFNKVN